MVFGITMGVMEIPSGYLCDLWGRKPTLMLGGFFWGVGYTVFYFADSFFLFALFEAIVGIAAAMVSGADFSLLYDSIQQNTSRGDKTKFVGNMQSYGVFGEAVASIGCGFLMVYSYMHVMSAQLVAAWVPFFVTIFLVEPKYKKMDKKSHKKNFKKILRHLFFSDRLLRLTFFNLVVYSLATFFVVWIFQKYWQQENIPLKYFGIIWATYNLTVGIVSRSVHKIERKMGALSVLIVMGLLPIFGYFGMSYFTAWFGVVIGLVFQIGRGLSSVILKDALNWRVPSEFRATANSIESLTFRIAFCIFGPIIGYTIDKQGVNTALFGLGVFYVILFILFLLPLLIQIKKSAIKEIPEGT